jgi:hypothetical protein
MLAAERKHELGIARRRDAQRAPDTDVRFRGALYALLGSVASVGVGWLMVRVIGKGFAGSGFEISFATSPENVVMAFCSAEALRYE